MPIISTTEEFTRRFPRATQIGGGVFDVGEGGKYRLSSGGTGYQKIEEPTSEIGIMTTDAAERYKQQLDDSLNQLSGTTGLPDLSKLQAGQTFQFGGQTYTKTPEGKFSLVSAPATTQTPLPKTEPPKITFLNENNQRTDLTGEAITPEAYQNLLNQGYFAIESSGNLPSWASVGDITSGRAQVQLQQAKKEKDDLIAGMSKFMVSDETLNNQIQSISALYDTRIRDMEDINRRRTESVKTLGVRLGSRYTGGEGGMFGGIITEEERQGANRITELQAKKQEAITEAKEAARTKNWSVYEKMITQAENAYKEQKDTVVEMNKKIIEQNKKIQEQKIRSSRDSVITDLIGQGITDSTTLLDFLNFYEDGTPTGGDFTFEEVNKILEKLKTETKSVNLGADINEWQYLLGLGEEGGGIKSNTTFMEYRKMKQKEVQAGITTLTPEIITTPSGEQLEYGTPEYVIERLKQTAGSKTKPVASEREQMGKFANVVALTDNLMGSLSKTTNDPILGYMRSLNPYDFDARAVNAQVIALVPSVARALYGEVGVLTDTDIERYLKTLPNIKSTTDQNRFIAAMTLSNAKRAYEQTLLNLANSNVNVSGFVDSYKNLTDKLSKIEKDIGVDKEVEITQQDTNEFNQIIGQPKGYWSNLWGAIFGR